MTKYGNTVFILISTIVHLLRLKLNDPFLRKRRCYSKLMKSLFSLFFIFYLLLLTYFKTIKSNLLTLYSLWIGSVANQVFHPVMFDKCIQILKKSWPQESNLSRKRKKEQPKNSRAVLRRHRKRGKPRRKEDIEVRSRWNNKAYLY